MFCDLVRQNDQSNAQVRRVRKVARLLKAGQRAQNVPAEAGEGRLVLPELRGGRGEAAQGLAPATRVVLRSRQAEHVAFRVLYILSAFGRADPLLKAGRRAQGNWKIGVEVGRVTLKSPGPCSCFGKIMCFRAPIRSRRSLSEEEPGRGRVAESTDAMSVCIGGLAPVLSSGPRQWMGRVHLSRQAPRLTAQTCLVTTQGGRYAVVRYGCCRRRILAIPPSRPADTAGLLHVTPS